ncbi:unnamed protein product [Clavelina lepadiformis]|uniref:Secreted protein n=1 Tax=Clavelina lepadiformis TaxID=159417 RepID=A0ABP0GCK5_CLALP
MIPQVLSLVCALVVLSDAQFAYPVDPNPPQASATFTCFACTGQECGGNQVRGRHREQSCTGSRVACWTIRNAATSTYTRMCGQPESIRQGVFCNRHMEGKEFCYAYNSPQGRVRLCAKCCLTNRCNRYLLTGTPDVSLQTCVACRGDREKICNKEVTLSAANSSYVEQCLLPNSDCWTQRQRGNDGVVTFSRGCQLRTCDEAGLDQQCATTRLLVND